MKETMEAAKREQERREAEEAEAAKRRIEQEKAQQIISAKGEEILHQVQRQLDEEKILDHAKIETQMSTNIHPKLASHIRLKGETNCLSHNKMQRVLQNGKKSKLLLVLEMKQCFNSILLKLLI